MVDTETLLYVMENPYIKRQNCTKVEATLVAHDLENDYPIDVVYYEDIKSGNNPQTLSVRFNKKELDELLNRSDTKSIIKIRLPHIGEIVRILFEKRSNVGLTKIKIKPVEGRNTVNASVTYFSKEFKSLDEVMPWTKTPIPSFERQHVISLLPVKMNECVEYEVYSNANNTMLDDETLSKISRFMKINKGIVYIHYHRYNSSNHVFYNIVNMFNKLGV